VHRREGESLEGLAVGEEDGGLAGLSVVGAVVAVVTDRAVIVGVGDDPAFVVERTADDAEVAVGDRFEVVKIGLDGGVDDLPVLALVVEGDGLHSLLGGMHERLAHVGLGVLGEDFLFAGLEVDGLQGRGVASAAVGHVERPGSC
jgi:hypothetical protein